MLSEYTVSRKEAIRRNVADVKQAAQEWNYSIEDSYKDWCNEGPNPEWAKAGVKKALKISDNSMTLSGIKKKAEEGSENGMTLLEWRDFINAWEEIKFDNELTRGIIDYVEDRIEVIKIN